MKVVVALLAVSVFAIGCGSPPGNEASTSNSDQGVTSGSTQRQSVSGNWSNTTPCNTTFFDQNTGKLQCDGFTDWTGSFTGSSHYFFDGFVNLHTGDVIGKLDETFTGSGAGASGTFHMDETITISASTGAIKIESVVDSGTDGYSNISGVLRFVGISDTSGIGTGTYTGNVSL